MNGLLILFSTVNRLRAGAALLVSAYLYFEYLSRAPWQQFFVSLLYPDQVWPAGFGWLGVPLLAWTGWAFLVDGTSTLLTAWIYGTRRRFIDLGLYFLPLSEAPLAIMFLVWPRHFPAGLELKYVLAVIGIISLLHAWLWFVLVYPPWEDVPRINFPWDMCDRDRSS